MINCNDQQSQLNVDINRNNQLFHDKLLRLIVIFGNN